MLVSAGVQLQNRGGLAKVLRIPSFRSLSVFEGAAGSSLRECKTRGRGAEGAYALEHEA